MRADPTAEHEWLMQLVGEWTSRAACVMPGGITDTTEGREVVRAIGEVWVVGEGTGPMPDGPDMTSVITLGYDPMKQKYVGSWIGSPMAQLIVYEGTREDDTLTLDCEGPAFEDPSKLATYQDIIEIRSPNERALISQINKPDGTWDRFMEVTYQRVSG